MNQKGFILYQILIVIVLLIIAGAIGYSLAKKNQVPIINNTSSPSPEDSALKTKLTDYEDKLSRLTSLQDMISFTPTSNEVNFACNTPDKLNSSDVISIEKDLTHQGRSTDIICSNSSSKQYVVDTFLSNKDSEIKRAQRVDLDSVDQNGIVSTVYLFQPEVTSNNFRSLKLNKWYSNGAIIFTLIHAPNGGPIAGNQDSGLTMTYVKQTNDPSPKLIEFCNWGVGGGTSAKEISGCTSFSQSKGSKYLQGNDI